MLIAVEKMSLDGCAKGSFSRLDLLKHRTYGSLWVGRVLSERDKVTFCSFYEARERE
jgi:hypothetical protein